MFAYSTKNTIPMKGITLALLLLIPLTALSQQTAWLNNVMKKDTVQTGQAIMYGSFIQRLGFSSGGFSQDISIRNVETDEVYTFRVKAAFKSARENVFCFHIPPGKYVIQNYYWTKSKWYGGTMYNEPIYKNVASSQVRKMVYEGQIKKEELQQYEFVIAPGTLNYLGTWRFDQEVVAFRDDKFNFDERLKGTYKNLPFSEAVTMLPH